MYGYSPCAYGGFGGGGSIIALAVIIFIILFIFSIIGGCGTRQFGCGCC